MSYPTSDERLADRWPGAAKRENRLRRWLLRHTAWPPILFVGWLAGAIAPLVAFAFLAVICLSWVLCVSVDDELTWALGDDEGPA